MHSHDVFVREKKLARANLYGKRVGLQQTAATANMFVASCRNEDTNTHIPRQLLGIVLNFSNLSKGTMHECIEETNRLT
jgi:hypothetical protein